MKQKTMEHTNQAVEATKELRDIFTPLCEATAELSKPDAMIDAAPELLAGVEQIPCHEWPNDRLTTRLPWDAFLGVDDALFSKDGRREAGCNRIGATDMIVDAYARRHPEQAESTERNWSHETPLEEFGNEVSAEIGRREINIEDWRKHEERMGQLAPEARETMSAMLRFRAHNSNRFHWERPDMRQTGELLFARNESIPNNVGSNIIMPIGEYGRDFAHTLIRAAAAMQTAAELGVKPMAEQAVQENENVLQTYTARAAGKGTVNTDTTMATLHEGILSIAQSIAILTTEKVDGYDDPKLLVKDIVKSGLVERLARYSPMGFVGPMALSGKFIPGSLERTEEGLRFSADFEQYLKQEREKYVARYVMSLTGDNARSLSPGEAMPLGKMCPVANRGGGIRALGDSFVELVDFEAKVAGA